MPAHHRTPKTARTPIDDLRGATRLVVEATRGVTDLGEALHHNIAGGPSILGRPLEGPTRLLTGPVYGSIRGVTRLVGAGLDVALARLAPLLAPLLAEGAPGLEREAVGAALNGVLGDYFGQIGNPLALEMRLRHGGHPLELERQALRLGPPPGNPQLVGLVPRPLLDGPAM